MKIYVITVCRNAKAALSHTIGSINSLRDADMHFSVIDGNSNDGTREMLASAGSLVDYWVSEPDDGIYDAMNKGLAVATGDYVLFMNSGDELYNSDTVASVFASADGADIYYGETEMINAEGQHLGRRRHKAPKELSLGSFKYGMSVSHQAIYIKRSLTQPYDRQYQLSSDIDWILNAVEKAGKIVNVNQYVAKYLVGGMSKKRHRQSLKERFAIMKHHYGVVPTLFNHLVIAFNLGWYWLLNRKTND